MASLAHPILTLFVLFPRSLFMSYLIFFHWKQDFSWQKIKVKKGHYECYFKHTGALEICDAEKDVP